MLPGNHSHCINYSSCCAIQPDTTTDVGEITRQYASVHGYVALMISIFGISTNAASMVVLTRPRMKKMVFNFLLLFLSMADFGQMLLYIPITLHFYIVRGDGVMPRIVSRSKYWMYYRAVFFILASILHTIAIWIVVTLATFRIICIRMPHKFTQLCNWRRAKICLAAVALGSVIIVMPLIPFYQVVKIDCVTFSIYTQALEETLQVPLSTWIYTTGAVIIPCSLLFIQTIILISSLRHAQRKHDNIMHNQVAGAQEETNHNTAMLVAIVIVVLLCELPYSIMPISDGKLYREMLEFMDILSHINNATNFIFYCTLNRNFRKTFLEIFCSVGRHL